MSRENADLLLWICAFILCAFASSSRQRASKMLDNPKNLLSKVNILHSNALQGIEALFSHDELAWLRITNLFSYYDHVLLDWTGPSPRTS